MTDHAAQGPNGSLAVAITSSLLAILVVVTGELEFSNADELELALASLAVSQVASIRLDLTGLRFCDTRGARVLIDFIGSIRNSGVQVSTVGAGPSLQKILLLVAQATAHTHG